MGTEPTVTPREPKADRGRCRLRSRPPRQFAPSVSAGRVRAILGREKMWANGTALRYYFFDNPQDHAQALGADGQTVLIPWAGSEHQKAVVRKAFDIWTALGIGLSFTEVTDRADAEVRIGFMAGDGHWSCLGREVLEAGPQERTMNLDGPLHGTDGLDVALHEIGHTLGMEHEHQNPRAGIVWNVPAVESYYAAYPNFWDTDTTHFNILRKIAADGVFGGAWNPDSIMHYPFAAGLIDKPERYRTGLTPAPGLSEKDKTWVRLAYPPLKPIDSLPALRPLHSLSIPLGAGEQADAVFSPDETGWYGITTFGQTDTVLTLFEETPGHLQFIAGDDDSGDERNASLSVLLLKDRRYVVRARLLYDRGGRGCTLMVH